MYRHFWKRFLDSILSALALIVLSPLLFVLAVLVRCRMGKPVIHCAERAGKGEKIFRMYKFRSMTDARGENGELLPDGERLTKLGRALRASSLDELPELWNVLKGDMSLVGPRPFEKSYLPYYTEREHHRHDVRPGITGLAQVNGRNSISWEEKFAYDLQYIENISFAADVKILLQTVKKVFVREGIGQGEDAQLGFDVLRQRDESGGDRGA